MEDVDVFFSDLEEHTDLAVTTRIKRKYDVACVITNAVEFFRIC